MRYGNYLSYSQFYQLCISTAEQEDSSQRHSMNRRRVHQHLTTDTPGAGTMDITDTGPPTESSSVSEATFYSINVASQASRVPDPRWKRLSTAAKQTWTSIDPEFRAIILGNNDPPKGPRQAQVSVADTASATAPATTSDGSNASALSAHSTATKPPKSVKFPSTQARHDALSAAHNGDPRRVLATPQPGSVSANASVSNYWATRETSQQDFP